jgi:UDP-N-acetylmuramate: L-alanyl-gamma-D-glutamyl-meso-diaminopimelate ligase
MGSTAIELKQNGFDVSGSDEHIYPPMSEELAGNNIQCHSGFDASHLDLKPDLVVIGNSLSRGNVEVEEVLNRKIPYLSLPELIKHYFIGQKHSFVLTGTHGKTSTSGLLTWIFNSAGYDPGYLIGGVTKNLPKSCSLTDSGIFVIEGDEYDTSFFDKRSKFLHYSPEYLVINNLEFDHADIFSSLDDVIKTFYNLISIVPSYGKIIYNCDDEDVRNLVENHPVVSKGIVPVLSYGRKNHADRQINNITYNEGMLMFGIVSGNEEILTIESQLIGEYSAYNITAAVISALEYGVSDEKIQKAVKLFSGIKKRMDVIGKVSGVTVIDDFAHHPTAIRETIRGARMKYTDKKIWAVFEPRSGSMRRNVFQAELSEALNEADTVIIAGINRPEKVKAGERLNPEMVINKITQSGKNAFYIPAVEDIVQFLKDNIQNGDVVIGMSNGGFDGFHKKLINKLSQ